MAGIDEGVVQVRADDEDEFTEDAVEALKSKVTRKKGRGFGDTGTGYQGQYESIDDHGDAQGPMRSIEGWIVFMSNIHEEAQEDDIHDLFSEYGEIKNIHLNLDRRTGFLKGYVLVEYETYKEANLAVEKLNGADFLGQRVTVDWAFVKPKEKAGGGGRRTGRR